MTYFSDATDQDNETLLCSFDYMLYNMYYNKLHNRFLYVHLYNENMWPFKKLVYQLNIKNQVQIFQVLRDCGYLIDNRC